MSRLWIRRVQHVKMLYNYLRNVYVHLNVEHCSLEHPSSLSDGLATDIAVRQRLYCLG